MICRSVTSPTGILFIEIHTTCTWHDFPKLAEYLLSKINAKDIQNITKNEVPDCHWYEFTWNGKLFRLIFEEWPRQCVMEALDTATSIDELLTTIGSVK
jgi:hypothetical protein